MKFSEIKGMKVFSSDAFLIGKIVGADVNTKKWTITHLHVELSGDALTKLDTKKPLLSQVNKCIPKTFIKTVGDVVTLSKTLEEVDELPEIKKV